MTCSSLISVKIRAHAPAIRAVVAGVLIGFVPLVTAAQPPMTACPAMDANLQPPMVGWTAKVDLRSAASVADLEKARLTIGRAARVKLHGAGEVTYPATPQKPGAPATQGGLLAFSVDQAASYRVGPSSGAWIDVVKDGQAQVSTAHSHGPDCSSLRKMVDFPLTPGAYVLQISGGADPEIGVMVAKLP